MASDAIRGKLYDEGGEFVGYAYGKVWSDGCVEVAPPPDFVGTMVFDYVIHPPPRPDIEPFWRTLEKCRRR